MYLTICHKLKLEIVLTSVLILLVSSCKILKPYSAPETVTGQSGYRGVNTNDTSNIAIIPRQALFNDPLLDSLINEALTNNTDLHAAIARIKKAEAAFKAGRLAFYPSLDLQGTAGRSKIINTPTANDYQIFANSAWEVDILGKLRNTKRASYDLLLKTEAARRMIETELVASVANSYFNLLALDAQLQIAEKTLENRQSDVTILSLLKESDMATGADVVQSQANLISVRIRIPDIKQKIFEAENALCVILGRTPGPIIRSTLDEQRISVSLSPGIPAQLLANRPDVQAAEYQLRYGYEMTNAARKYFYPSLTIAATAGYDAARPDDLFNPSSLFWSLIGSLTQPVFHNGLNRQRLATALADQEENIAAYKQTILVAGQEVANAVHGYQASAEKIELRTSQIAYLQKSVDFTMELLKYTSTTNYLDVLTSEVSLLDAQLASIDDRLSQLQYVVSLYRSVGGGWKK